MSNTTPQTSPIAAYVCAALFIFILIIAISGKNVAHASVTKEQVTKEAH